MRENGATSVEALCDCGHHAVVDVSSWSETIHVPAVRFSLRCSKCGKRPSETRPAWPERKAWVER